MKYRMFPGGFVVAPLFECRVADPPTRRTCPPDQWCLPANAVQVTAVHFHLVFFEDVAVVDTWTVGLIGGSQPMAIDLPLAAFAPSSTLRTSIQARIILGGTGIF